MYQPRRPDYRYDKPNIFIQILAWIIVAALAYRALLWLLTWLGWDSVRKVIEFI